MILVLAIGIAAGCVYSLVAVGYSMIYRTTGIVNFAQGTFVMIGGMIAWWLWSAVQIPYVVALVGGVVAAGLLGYVQFVLLVLPLWRRKAPPFAVLLSTFAFSGIIGILVLLWLGGTPQTLPAWLGDARLDLQGAGLASQYVLVVVGTLLAMVAVGAVLQQTTLGRTMRACSASRDTSELLGISPERNGLITLVTSAMLGGFGGILITPAQFTSAIDAPFVYGVYGFVAAIFGGLGSLRGALAGGLLIGVLQALVGRYLDPTYSSAIVFGALLIVLALRPQGLFGGHGEAEFF